jgi:molybdate transport system ATP-binding protein
MIQHTTKLQLKLENITVHFLKNTHDPLEAMIMADRLVVIENGRIVQQGSPAQVARQPATQYVARLVGLNLYAGTLEAATRRVFLDDGGTFTVTLGDEDGQAPTAGVLSSGRVLVGLRPSAITIHTAAPTHASPRNVWRGIVGGLELLTDRVRVQVDATPPALVDISAAAVADLALRPGTGVWLSAKATETEAYPDPAGASRSLPGRVS